MRNKRDKMSSHELQKRLKALRIHKGHRENRTIPVVDVAEASGVNRATLTNWENGRNVPDEVTVAPLADYYGVSPFDLLDSRKTLRFDENGNPFFENPKDVLQLLEAGLKGKGPEVRSIPGEILLVPVTGEVPAGETAIAWELEPDENVALSPDLAIRGHEYRAVRVFGDSMEGIGIHAGARIVYDRTTQARSGDVVVAEIHGEYTVKTYFPSGDRVILQAANPRYEPISVSRNEVRIEGVVVQVSFSPRRVERRGN